MKHSHLIIIGVAAVAVGFVLANAPSGTGIYATPVGQTLANLYTATNNYATGQTAGTTS